MADEFVTGEQLADEFVTGEQLDAVINVLRVLVEHYHHVSENAETAAIAAGNLLVDKGLISGAEWDEAYDRVKAERQTLLAMDPDAQEAMKELRRMFSAPENSDKDIADESE
jgi:hypothetical protein